MPGPMADNNVTVIQADRDAAAAYYYSAGGSAEIAGEIRDGKKDTWFRVQAFARHRLSSIPTDANERLAEDLAYTSQFVESAPSSIADDTLLETVERLRGLLAEATPGPWETGGSASDVGVYIGAPRPGNAPRLDSVLAFGEAISDCNADLIVETINALPSLLGRVEEILGRS